MIKNLLYSLSRSHYGKIFFVLFLFLALSLVSLFVFYNGFLINFELINAKLFGEKIGLLHQSYPYTSGNVPGFLNHVPYHSFSILLSSLLHPYFLFGLVILYFPLIFLRRKFFSKEFIYQTSERILVFAAAFLLTWELVTYDYNYYLDSAFYFDRFFLIILTFALLRFPLLTPLYIAFAFVYRSQFNYPVAGFELYDKRLLFDILILFVSFRYIKAFIPDLKFSFVWLTMCIVASNYFYTGVAKIIMSPHGYEWLTQNNLADLFLNVHLRGWMANVSEDTLHSIWSLLDRFHIPLQILILITELSALFLLKSRKLSLLILSSSFLMHLAIFICGSMLFWKWMAIDLTLFYLIWKNKKVVEEMRYKVFFSTSVIIILFAFAWLRPYMIGWFDTPVNQYFTYEVEDRNGNIYQLPKNEMNPYHQWFQYDHFLFLVNKPCFPVTGFGYTYNYKLSEKLRGADAGSVLKLREEYGFNQYDSRKGTVYYSFIQTYFKNRNRLLGNSIFLTALRAPYHLHGTSKGKLYPGQAPVTYFRVIYNLSLSKSGNTEEIERAILIEIPIPE